MFEGSRFVHRCTLRPYMLSLLAAAAAADNDDDDADDQIALFRTSVVMGLKKYAGRKLHFFLTETVNF